MAAVGLFRFDGAPRRVRRVDPPDYAVLAEHLAAAAQDEAAPGWSVDFDPRWRTLLLLSHGDDADSDSPYYKEVVLDPATGVASRQEAKLEVKVSPADAAAPGITIALDGLDAVDAAPAAHGIRRACRSGPGRGHPVLQARFEVRMTGSMSLGDVHAAAQQAASRALGEAGTAATRVDGAGNGEIPTFPELETSIAEVAINLEELCLWPVAAASEVDRKQLGAFLAYQLSLLYGHSLDERMRRVPGAPAAPLREFMGGVTDDLLAYAADKGEAGEMVSGLIETWTASWRSAGRG